MPAHPPPKISHAELSESHRKLVNNAKELYQERLAYFAQTHKPPAYIVAAPGRVNLIGEHVDYQNGFVLPLAMEYYSTVVYGTGYLHTGKSNAATTIRLRLVSDQADVPEMIEERRLSGGNYNPPNADDERSWVNYVLGVIVQYTPDMPAEGCVLDLAMAYSSNIPVGAGLSSSAALEVATAAFLECFLHDGMAYSAVQNPALLENSSTSLNFAVEQNNNGEDVDTKVTRALRCQTAENEWAHSPCGIMDQFIVSCGVANHLLLLDCQTLHTTQIPVKMDTEDHPVFLIANSNVEHSVADSEYGKRRHECNEAVELLQSVPLYHVESLRDATVADIDMGKEKGKLDDVLYKRAHHVITENTRTKECCAALKLGLYDKVGALMNASHASLRDDYQVSCKELDILQELAVAQPGVFGSRMTGGGFGGCTVTLVQQENVEAVKEALVTGYKEATGKKCDCFVTKPGQGARALAIDMDCMPESDFYKG